MLSQRPSTLPDLRHVVLETAAAPADLLGLGGHIHQIVLVQVVGRRPQLHDIDPASVDGRGYLGLHVRPAQEVGHDGDAGQFAPLLGLLPEEILGCADKVGPLQDCEARCP